MKMITETYSKKTDSYLAYKMDNIRTAIDNAFLKKRNDNTIRLV